MTVKGLYLYTEWCGVDLEHRDCYGEYERCAYVGSSCVRGTRVPQEHTENSSIERPASSSALVSGNAGAWLTLTPHDILSNTHTRAMFYFQIQVNDSTFNKGAVVKQHVSYLRQPGSIPRGMAPGNIAYGNRAGRCCWSAGFLGDLPFPYPFIPALLHTRLTSPTSAIKTSILRATQISPLHSINFLYIYFFQRPHFNTKQSPSLLLKYLLHRLLLLLAQIALLDQQVAERLACSPPTEANLVQSPVVSPQIFASGNRVVRYRWSTGYLRDIPFPLPLHSGTAQFSPHFTLIGSQDVALESSAGVQWREKREIPADQWHHPAPISNCKNLGVTRPGSPWWEASKLTAQHHDPYIVIFKFFNACGGSVVRLLPLSPRRTGFDSRRGRSPDFRIWESCLTTPLVGGFSRGSPVFPPKLSRP
ncbi:hypothetical protein PR048_002164 [Dryococelus australis]|uniref:Uncharacterized protein n=1 Tax=Dryococelus australis TaxID=614101 RepID=A0ABQ9IJE5_9NEOP|nr:hypothetical protein PR048_002164 [Dryococelus australis]